MLLTTWHGSGLQVQEIPEEEVALSERVHGILLAANGGEERMIATEVSECLYNAGLGLRYVQVREGCDTIQEDNSFGETQKNGVG